MDRPEHGSHPLDPSTLAWAPTDTPGFWQKPLLAEGDGGSTTLMRIDPGAHADVHHHGQLEEIFVLDGEFSDQDRTYGPGQYCVRAPGAEHTTYSEGGCTVLVVYRP
jgi:anti-sigma factor ChrR (cupin superfamily)